MRRRSSSRSLNATTETQPRTQDQGTVAPLSTELDMEPTLTFFAKPHTISVLVLMLAYFLYVALYVTEDADGLRNTKM
jgi:hypothetical protein